MSLHSEWCACATRIWQRQMRVSFTVSGGRRHGTFRSAHYELALRSEDFVSVQIVDKVTENPRGIWKRGWVENSCEPGQSSEGEIAHSTCFGYNPRGQECPAMSSLQGTAGPTGGAGCNTWAAAGRAPLASGRQGWPFGRRCCPGPAARELAWKAWRTPRGSSERQSAALARSLPGACPRPDQGDWPAWNHNGGRAPCIRVWRAGAGGSAARGD
jgi:hypothetical protein